jgi:ParB family transcriptional regulator, chromosome partitioning protein
MAWFKGKETMTTIAAANAAKHSTEKEKVEKRRALGRGLESLLPGPRVVAGAAVAQGAGGAKQIPPIRVAEGRNDNSQRADKIAGGIPAVAASSESSAVLAGGAPATEVVDVQTVADAGDIWGSEGFDPQRQETITIHAQADSRIRSNVVAQIPLDHIDKNPYQTRYLFDDELLKELADSIRANGLVQPVVVRPGEEEGRYVLILGERRCRAAKMAGRSTIPAIVRRVSEQQAAEMTIIENLQRQDLNCIEQAEAFRVLSKDFNLTQQQIGERVGMSRESVSNYMRLLKLPPLAMEYVATNKLGFSEARELLAIENQELLQKAADEVVKKHLSIEQVEELVAKYNGWPLAKDPGGKQQGARWVDPNVRAAQTELERLLQVRVRIRDRRGRGKIVIEYATVNDYERVVGMLRGSKN